MDEADPERAERSAHGVAVLLRGVRMRMQIEVAVSPAHEQADTEKDDEGGNGSFRALLHSLGEIPLSEEDRHPEHDERDPVADSPPCAQPRGRSRRPLPARRDERRHRSDVIRVGRVP